MSSSRKRSAAAVSDSQAAPASGKGKGKAAAAAMDDAADDTAAASAASNSAAASGSAAAPAASGAPVAGVKRANKSIRASDQKRKKLVPRCTSPSHFLMEYTGADAAATANPAHPPSLLSSPLPSALSSDPNAPASTHVNEAGARIDAFLHSIGSMYYRNHASLSKDASAAGPATEVWVAADYDKLEYPTLDLLLSPLRKPHVLDSWCPREIALFEAGICAVGKDFHAIARLITTKSCKECVDFYYVWKKSSHYALWKNFGKPAKKPHANKEEQWKAIREQMKPPPSQQAAATAANGTAANPPSATTAAAQSAMAATAGTPAIKKE